MHDEQIDATVSSGVDQELLEAGIASEAAGEPIDLDPTTVQDRRCETTDGVPVDLRQMVAAALVGRIRTIIADGAGGAIVAAGRKRQLSTAEWARPGGSRCQTY